MIIDAFYTYLWLREDGTPYYVGKGSGNRAFWRRPADKLQPPTKDRIIVQEWPSEEDAFAAEKFLIEYYGRKDQKSGVLVNFTNGGDGASGAVRTEEFKEKLRVANVGKEITQEAKEKMRQAKIGIKHTDIWKENHRKMMVGRKHTLETKKKMSQWQIGKKLSEETKQKIREAALRRFKNGN
jgi:hypothetical protein